MSKRNPGGLISTTGLREPSATDQSQNSGVWTLEEQYQAETNGTWANPSGQTYEITNSLRFRNSATAYINRTFSTAGNRKTWTWSGWVKRSTNNSIVLMSVSTGSPNFLQNSLFFSGDRLRFFCDLSISVDVNTSALFRDYSAWYHVVCAFDTTKASAADRVKLYVNGIYQNNLVTASYPSQNAEAQINNTSYTHTTGLSNNVAFGDFYLTEVNFIDGQALDPSSFGYFDYNGVWQPKKYTGGYGRNGFYLPFNPQAYGDSITTGNLGLDKSGNGNNWTTNNISVTAGVNYDLMKDSPTNGSTVEDTGLGGQLAGNYCTYNPLTQNNVTISAANLQVFCPANGGSGDNWTFGTFGVTSGKWYYEVTSTQNSSGNNLAIGFIKNYAGSGNPNVFSNSNSWTAYGNVTYNGGVNNTALSYGSWDLNETLMIALDADAGKIWFGVNGVWNSNINPSTGNGAMFTNLLSSGAGTFMPVLGEGSSSETNTAVANFGQRPFAYAAPAGFKCLNTANLPMPTIPDGKDYFNVVTYTGTGAGQTISSVGFQPDWIWIKERNGTGYPALFDSARGATVGLSSATTLAEVTDANSLTSFNSNGFSVGSGGGNFYVNRNTYTYVAWNWKAGGAGVSNTAGSITSTVSANTTSGFSIATYVGNGGIGASGATFGHGLGVAPSFIIIKNRSSGTANWSVWHKSLTAGEVLYLNLTNAKNSDTNVWGNTLPSSTVVKVGNSEVNGNTNNHVAYCFAEVAGFSAFGSYTGNGSTDGPFVFCGFRPRYVMIKVSSGTTDSWIILDSVRNTYNVTNSSLFAEASAAESTGSGGNVDFLSNGFKLRTADSGRNGNTFTYIFAAFAENPFKISRAR